MRAQFRRYRVLNRFGDSTPSAAKSAPSGRGSVTNVHVCISLQSRDRRERSPWPRLPQIG